jgi:predicted metal-binding membrane protein
MMWMPMPGQNWLGAATMFLIMWLAMMIAMMLPSALPTILIFRRLLHFRREAHPALATAVMASAYFLVWLGFGMLAFGLGVMAGWSAMRWAAVSRAVPAVSGALLIVSGLFQFTRWKLACLGHCRDPLGFVASHSQPGIRGGWNLGLHHGLFCAACCWGLMLIQLVLGIMSLTVMAIVAGVIALEKLLPRAEPVVRITGVAAIGAGLVLIGRALL